MSRNWSLLVVPVAVLVVVFGATMTPRVPVAQSKVGGLAAYTAPAAHSEVVDAAPAEVLAAAQEAAIGPKVRSVGRTAPARADAAQFREAYIGSVRCLPGAAADEGVMLEVWSLNVAPTAHMLFNRFTVNLPDGSRAEESAGSEVRPGQWLHSTYRLPSMSAGQKGIEYQVELIELGTFVDYVHDSARGRM